MVVAKPKPGATSASGVRFALYKAYSELPDPSTLDPKAAYADFKPDSVHLICPMNLSSDKPLVDFIFMLPVVYQLKPTDTYVPTSQEWLHHNSLSVNLKKQQDAKVQHLSGNH
ncbi:Telomere repeats-binding bouquet formation protein 1 [Labeo rohita]|uniref:Telomere repeats-binding bouquet formation protein 1 n=1 Tax=Labeo rohita TaxID=84645 RepID=A0ABQ8LGU3_LABRO|nr:Telomere repeats-binding bouquet formation protein 1 [Labeo rohita]